MPNTETSFLISKIQARCQRSGLEVSRATMPFASRSSCTHLSHQPAFAPPGNSVSGRCKSTASAICKPVRPGGLLGSAFTSASFIALYFLASTACVRPEDITFSTRTRGLYSVAGDIGVPSPVLGCLTSDVPISRTAHRHFDSALESFVIKFVTPATLRVKPLALHPIQPIAALKTAVRSLAG
jgi:hypothetical protein